MKIRQGFVSNSSTSSFLIYGTHVDEFEEAENEDVDMCEKADKAGLQFHSPEDGGYYIGLSWDEVKDDETGKEFKARAKKAVDKFMGKKMECETHQGEYSC